MTKLADSAQIKPDYIALRDGAVVQVRPEYGVLLLSDADRADFLQRMTTNNIAALQPGQSTVTVLTSDVARTIFAFTVVCRTDDLLLLPGQGEADGLARDLQSKIFFMDKVDVANISRPVRRLRVMGPQAAEILAKLGFDFAATLPSTASMLDEAGPGVWVRQGDVTAVMQPGYDVPGYELLVPAAGLDELVTQLQAGGATLLTDADAYHARRIELGRPTPGTELTGAYNPLESGLAWTCAENKGCYTGQEIIARQVTYDKVTKTLVGLRSAALLETGQVISVDGRTVGEVTSAGFSPTLDAPIALAVIKRPHNLPGAQVHAGEATAEVTALPFVDEG